MLNRNIQDKEITRDAKTIFQISNWKHLQRVRKSGLKVTLLSLGFLGLDILGSEQMKGGQIETRSLDQGVQEDIQ